MWRRPLAVLTLTAALVLSGGCVRRVSVIVPPGEPVQLARPTKAKVWVIDSETGQLIETTTTPPAGHWVLPDPGE